MPGIGEAGFILALVGLRLAAAGLRGVDLLLDQGRPSLQHGIHPAEQDLFQNQIEHHQIDHGEHNGGSLEVQHWGRPL